MNRIGDDGAVLTILGGDIPVIRDGHGMQHASQRDIATRGFHPSTAQDPLYANIAGCGESTKDVALECHVPAFDHTAFLNITAFDEFVHIQHQIAGGLHADPGVGLDFFRDGNDVGRGIYVQEAIHGGHDEFAVLVTNNLRAARNQRFKIDVFRNRGLNHFTRDEISRLAQCTRHFLEQSPILADMGKPVLESA